MYYATRGRKIHDKVQNIKKQNIQSPPVIAPTTESQHYIQNPPTLVLPV